MFKFKAISSLIKQDELIKNTIYRRYCDAIKYSDVVEPDIEEVKASNRYYSEALFEDDFFIGCVDYLIDYLESMNEAAIIMLNVYYEPTMSPERVIFTLFKELSNWWGLKISCMFCNDEIKEIIENIGR